MIKVLRAKLHGIRVTGAELDYHGSITLDPEHCERAGILPLEFVEVWNKSTGARFSTYVIHGEPGSRCCVLNGAAARLCQPGDEIIVAASEYIERAELDGVTPTVLTFGRDNQVTQELTYVVSTDARGRHRFRVERKREFAPEEARRQSLAAARSGLEHEDQAFVDVVSDDTDA